MTESVEYLIPTLRLKIGDINSATYRYMDEWLVVALIASVRSLERYWGSKYIITEGGAITRNTGYTNFEFEESEGVIQRKDEHIIVTKAALIILEGSLENSAWAIGSWKDAEISVSNIEAGKLRTETLRNLRTELDSLIKSPMKRLTKGSRATILEEVTGFQVVPEDTVKIIII
jgi:hypothetical protein